MKKNSIFKKFWNSRTHDQKIAIILGTLTLSGAGLALTRCNHSFSKKTDEESKYFTVVDNTLYLFDVCNDDESIVVTDKDGNPINCMIDDSTKAVISCKGGKIHPNVSYEAFLLDGHEYVNYGYIEGKFLEGKYIDSINTTQDELSLFYVASSDGANIIPYDDPSCTSNSLLTLKAKGKIIVGLKSLQNNERSIKEFFTIYNEKFISGYVDSSNVFNKNYLENDSIVNNVVIADSLDVRSNHDLSSNVINNIQSGKKVKVLNFGDSYNDGEFDWSYVAFEVDGSDEIEFGWVINSCMQSGHIVNYLVDESDPILNVDIPEDLPSEPIIELEVNVDSGVLNLRSEPGLNSNTMQKLKKGTPIFVKRDDYEVNYIEMDNLKWIYIMLSDGTNGWVCRDYVSAKRSGVSNVNSIFSKNYGEFTGKYGIDINLGSNPEKLDRLLTEGLDVSYSHYVEEASKKIKPSFAIVKCGATGNRKGSDMHFGTLYNSQTSNFEALIQVLNKHSIPFTIYYYTQAINNDEAQKEFEVIQQAYNVCKKYDLFSKHIYIDFEADGAANRIYESAQENGKDYQTAVGNYLLNLVNNNIIGAKAHVYTDPNTLESTLNFDLFDDRYKNGSNWFTNISETQDNYLFNQGLKRDYVGIFQISDNYTTKYDISVDIDFMLDSFYSEFISEIPVALDNNQTISYEVVAPTDLKSKNVAVLDVDSGELIYSNNENELKCPASVTKIYTAYLVLKYGDLNDTITLTEKNTKLPGIGYNTKNYKAGDTFSVEDALYVSIMRSDNSVTDALADYIERKYNCKFPDLMNYVASQIGCTNFNFTNPYGNSDKTETVDYSLHKVSALDMAKILSYAMKDCPKLIEIMGTEYYSFKSNYTNSGPSKIANFLGCVKHDSPQYIDGILGGKSGFTNEAGKTLITAYERNGKRIVVVCFGNYSGSYPYSDAKKLADYAYYYLENKHLLMQGPEINFSQKRLYYKKIG